MRSPIPLSGEAHGPQLPQELPVEVLSTLDKNTWGESFVFCFCIEFAKAEKMEPSVAKALKLMYESLHANMLVCQFINQ